MTLRKCFIVKNCFPSLMWAEEMWELRSVNKIKFLDINLQFKRKNLIKRYCFCFFLQLNLLQMNSSGTFHFIAWALCQWIVTKCEKNRCRARCFGGWMASWNGMKLNLFVKCLFYFRYHQPKWLPIHKMRELSYNHYCVQQNCCSILKVQLKQRFAFTAFGVLIKINRLKTAINWYIINGRS